MTDKPKSLDDLFNEEESTLARRARERAEQERAYNERPEVIARRKAEIEKEIKQGLRDAEGNRIDPPEEEELDEDEDEDEDEETDDDDD